LHPAFGIRDDEHAELRLPESLLEIAGDGILQIVPNLGFPDGKPFVSEVCFKERGEDLLRSDELEVSVGDQANAGFERLVEAYPPLQPRVGDGNRSVFHGAIYFVYGKLVRDKEIGHKHFVLRPSQTAEGYLGDIGSGWRESVERLLSPVFGSEEESAEKLRLGKTEQSVIRSSRRSESGDTLGLFPIDDPHDRKLAQEMPVAVPKDDAPAVIPKHEVFLYCCGSRPLAGGRFLPRFRSVYVPSAHGSVDKGRRNRSGVLRPEGLRLRTTARCPFLSPYGGAADS